MKALVASALVATVWMGCGGESAPPSQREDSAPQIVSVEAVAVAEVPVTVEAVGTTEPYARATPGTRLLGRVAQVSIEEGDRVAKGKVLVRIEHRDLTAKRQQAAGALKEAFAVLENAESSVKRIRNLYSESAVSKQKRDEAEMAYARAQAGVAGAEGALEEVDANLGYSAVASPLDGVVIRKFVQEGDMAAPGAPLFTVEQQDSMKVVVEVSEQDLAYIRTDRPVPVSVEALGLERQGRVEGVVPSANPRSRTFQVKVVVENGDRVVRSGMFARVQFQKDTREGLLIPEDAVVRQGQLQGVFIVSGNRARLRWVRLGKRFGTRVEVLSGLEAGDRVVTSGGDGLSEGRRVEVKSDV